MQNSNSCPSLLDGWSVKPQLWEYILICFLLSLAVRFVHCVIKAWSAGYGELGDDLTKFSFCRRLVIALCGFNKTRLADQWLATIIGFAEVSFYPILLSTNNLSVIGGWLAIKTAGGWNQWHEHPIAFNRFLVSNLINLGIAFFLTLKGIIRVT